MTEAIDFTFEYTMTTTPESIAFIATFAASHDKQKIMTYSCSIVDNFSCSVSQQPSINGIYILKSVESTDTNEIFTSSGISISVKLNNVDQVLSISFADGENALNLLRIF